MASGEKVGRSKRKARGPVSRLLREAARATWQRWAARDIGLAFYWLGATGLFFAWFQRTETYWTAAYHSVAAGVPALLLYMVTVFVEELAKAPAALRRTRMEPPSLEGRITVRNDAINQNVLELDREILQYEQFKKNIGHGAVNDEHADKALAKLTSRMEQFGRYIDNATFEEGSWRRRRAARATWRRIGQITHATDLALVKEELARLKKTW